MAFESHRRVIVRSSRGKKSRADSDRRALYLYVLPVDLSFEFRRLVCGDNPTVSFGSPEAPLTLGQCVGGSRCTTACFMLNFLSGTVKLWNDLSLAVFSLVYDKEVFKKIVDFFTKDRQRTCDSFELADVHGLR
ncbi:hypothetical protein EVAR_85985_1 [Eumeta japonica]|uniref:Uncharacterized protein n=1 Tax=Eumeta variegata TaxID=151549 RepID=A0A4C1UJ32_EUMVA|nr:hypothetical protein EVAR_85985_1 [Eumeta japonica]